jgi:hypothetical protein
VPVDFGYSLFTEALVKVLDPAHPATTLAAVLQAADEVLDELWRAHGKDLQQIWVLGETAASRRDFKQVICDTQAELLGTEANPWAEAIRASHLWPQSPFTEDFRSAVLELAGVCWSQHLAARKAMPDDPWVDDGLPVRVLGALRKLTSQMEGLELNAGEAALLCLAPVVREAVYARAIERVAQHEPLSLVDTGSGHGLRGGLEKIHRALPRLLRKAERLRVGGGERAADQVALWLMHRALLREPRVFSPAGQHDGLLDGPVNDALNQQSQPSALVRAALTPARLLELARCCYATPDHIEREDRPGALQSYEYCEDASGEGFLIRERLLGYLLLVAGAMAIDPRLLSEVLVEHVGVSYTPPLDTMIKEISDARWEPESAGRKLRAVCSHPAPDYALREQVDHANMLLVAAHRATEHSDCSPLSRLPARFSADGLKAAETESGLAYRTPHLRFRLAQDQVLELLMGEQLYGDPALAIRELYQNALDACRYAQARLTYLKRAGLSNVLDEWTGRICFRQGIDGEGRPYIECEDNGIGMGVRELTDTFTQAGRRFVDTPEFIEEQAEWLAHDVRLYANSQFGIGVLSYFMLADDFEVETRRMDRRGQPGEALNAAISGSGSLILLRSSSCEQSGTRVRLYLSRSEVKGKPISVVDTLEALLWVADFETHAADANRALRWSVGRLGHDDNPALHAATCPTTNPDFWWKAPAGYQWPFERSSDPYEGHGQGFLLADGLVTSTERARPFCVVNLRGERRPRLTVDRKRALVWESDWIAAAANKESQVLLAWDAHCFVMVAEIAKKYPLAASRLWAGLKSRMSRMSVTNAYWPLRDEHRRQLNWETQGIPDLSDEFIFPNAGCWALDADFFAAFRSGLLELSGAILPAAISAAYRRYPPALALRRLKAFAQTTGYLAHAKELINLEDVPELAPTPGDALLISRYPDGEPWLLQEVPPGHILHYAAQFGRRPTEVVARLRQLGLSPREPQPDWDLFGPLHETDRILIPWDLDGEGPWLERDVSLSHILQSAIRLKARAAEIVARLRALGFTLPGPQPDWEALGRLDEADLRLISQDLDGLGPWVQREVPRGHVFAAAALLEKDPNDVVTRLQQLGFSLRKLPSDGGALLPLDKADRRLISQDLDGLRPWLKGEVPLGQILLAAAELKKQPAEVVVRLGQLGFSPSELPPDWTTIGALANTDRRLISQAFDGNAPWLSRNVPLSHVLFAADELNRPPREIVARLRQLGFHLTEPQPAWETIDEVDRQLLLELGRSGIWPRNRVPVALILLAAAEVGSHPGEIVTRLRRLDFLVPGSQPDWETLGPLDEADRTIVSVQLNGKAPWLGDNATLRHIAHATGKIGRHSTKIVGRLLQLGFQIQRGAWPNELAMIVQILDDCTREEARQRLVEAGWTPDREAQGVPNMLAD